MVACVGGTPLRIRGAGGPSFFHKRVGVGAPEWLETTTVLTVNGTPSRALVIADLPFGRLGLSICYDLRFPQLYRALAIAGAEFIAVPAAFTRQTGEAHWHVLIRARAIETGAFVLAATQGGLHENGRATFGHSLIVSPWGEVVAEGGEAPGVIFADLDLAASAEARARIPALKHGRDFEVEIAGCRPREARREAS